MEKDLEEQKELSASRLAELEKLNTEYQNSLKQIEKLKADVSFDTFSFGLLSCIFKLTRVFLLLFASRTAEANAGVSDWAIERVSNAADQILVSRQR